MDKPRKQPTVKRAKHEKLSLNPGKRREKRAEPRSGESCPACGETQLDYDGLLNLSCPSCGYTAGGGCT